MADSNNHRDNELDFYNCIIDLEGCYSLGKLELQNKDRKEQLGRELVLVFSGFPPMQMGDYLTEAREILEPLECTDNILSQLEAVLKTKMR
jgi:hypothetical protein